LKTEIFKVDADTGDVTQLTVGNSSWSSTWHAPDISADGSAVVFGTGANLTGGNADGGLDIFRIDADGSGVVQLTSGTGGEFSIFPRISADGTWCTLQSNGNFTGQNVDGSYEVFRVRATDGGQLQQLSIAHDSFSEPSPDISGDGSRIVYSSSSDPLGTNPEGNFEIFLFDAAGPTTTQLTSYAEGDSTRPRISQDGTFVYFFSTAPVFEDDPDEPVDLYGVDVATGVVVRVGAERGTVNAFDVWLSHISADATGIHAAFTGQGDFIRENPDANPEVWLIDRAAPQTMRPSGPSPTSLSWDYDSGPLRYDVIRGDLSQISADPFTIHLGPTICLENDSPDASTSGYEDTEDPLPGQVFFYLHRGSQGLSAGPGSWGSGTGGRPRLGGACES